MPRRWTRWTVPGLLLACALVLLPGLGQLTVTREQELRVALTARAMARGGSWLVPEYLGAPRLQKPPLLYWIVASAYRLAGTDRSASVARLPVVLLGAGLVLATYLGGREMVGRRRAALGAAICASSWLFIRHARLCETDIPLAFFTASAVFLVHRALRRGTAGPWWAAGLCAGLGFLTKGPAAVALPLAALGTHLAWTRSARARLRGPAALGGLAAAALLSASWHAAVALMPAASATAAGAAGSELQAITVGMRHGGPVFYYLYALVQAMLPWGPLWFVAAWDTARRGRRHARTACLAAWFLSSLLALSLLSSKQMHYATLLLAPGSLILGSLLHRAFAGARDWRRRLAGGYLAGLCALGAAGGLAAFAASWRAGIPGAGVLRGAGLALAAAGAAGLAPTARPGRRLAAVLAMVALGTAGYATGLDRVWQSQSLVAPFAEAVRRRVAPQARIAYLGSHSNAFEFHLGWPVLRPAGNGAAPRETSAEWCVVARRDGHDDPAAGAAPLPAEPALAAEHRGLRFSLYRLRDP